MSSENLQQPTHEKLQRLHEEMHEELMKAINNSEVCDVLEKYGLTADKIVKFQVILDLYKIQNMSDSLGDPEIQASLRAIPGEELVLAACCWCGTRCCPCW
jgi:hypothetical protein